MRLRLGAALAIILLMSACNRMEREGEPAVSDFALSLKVDAPGAQVQRVDLPAAALIALRRRDGGDIRIVDAHDRLISIALIEPDAVQRGRVHLDAIPFGKIVEEEDVDAPLSVRVDQQQGVVSIRAEGGAAAPGESAVVFDSRRIDQTVTGIALDAELPPSQPVKVSIAKGSDLKVWEPLSEQILFRAGDGPEFLGGSRISLPPSVLKGQFLRISWHKTPGIRIFGGTLFTAAGPETLRVPIEARGAELSDSRSLVLAVPSGVMPKAMCVRMTGSDGIMPLKLYGREASEHPWTLLAMASLKQGGPGTVLEIGGMPARFLKLAADRRSAGFSKPPAIAFEYDPIILAAALNGDGPYRLLVGNSAAEPKRFALSELTDARGPLPRARVTGAPPQVAIALAPSGREPFLAPRTIALWSALLAGVAVLAFAAYRLIKANDDH